MLLFANGGPISTYTSAFLLEQTVFFKLNILIEDIPKKLMYLHSSPKET